MNTPAPPRHLRIAAAQYDITPLAHWNGPERRIAGWVDEAAGAGAGLLLFPEYFAMELASLFGPEVPLSLPRQLSAMQELLPGFLALFARLAASAAPAWSREATGCGSPTAATATVATCSIPTAAACSRTSCR